MAERADELAYRWLEQIAERLPEEPHRLFPTRTLLNRMPEVLRRLALCLATDAPLAGDDGVASEIGELIELRRSQGYGFGELLREFELLGALFFEALDDALGEVDEEPSRAELLAFAFAVHRAFLDLFHLAAASFSELRDSGTRERAELLNRYAHALEHELRNRSNTASLRIQLAREAVEQGDREAAIRNLDSAATAAMRLTSTGLDSITSMSLQRSPADGGDSAATVALDALIAQLRSQLRSYARHHGARIECDPDLPDVQIDAGRLQLALGLLISAAVRAGPTGASEGGEVRLAATRAADEARIEIVRQDAAGGAEALGDGSPEIFLPLARMAIEQLEGSLEVEKDAERGHRFVVTIRQPLPELDGPESPAESGSR